MKKIEYQQLISDLEFEIFKVQCELMRLQSQLDDAEDLRSTLVDAKKISEYWSDPDNVDYGAKILALTVKIDTLLSKISYQESLEAELEAKLNYFLAEGESMVNSSVVLPNKI